MASFVEAQGHGGDERNFDVLYRTYRSEVQRLASYLLRSTTDAEDASQTVFLNVLRALRQGVQPTDPRAWLLAITRNVCFSRRRAAASRPDEVELDPETLGRPEDDGGPNADEIVGALARLTPNQRTAIILRDFRGVPRAEISQLLALSPAGVEALLTRARTRFREELEADRQPFDCAETRALVEQQLEGLITVDGRHSLRAHLRHCSPCSTLARAVRSSRGKLAGILFWPGEIVGRLVSALSQAPTAVHVAAAVSTTAAVAGVAIPVALINGPTAHVEGRVAPGPALVVHHSAPALTSVAPTGRSASRAASVASIAPRLARAAHAAHRQTRDHRVHRSTHDVAVIAAQRAAASGAAVQPTTSGSPALISVQRVSSHATAPTVSEPVAVPPRSTSPATRPTANPKPARRGSSRQGSKGRHSPAPRDSMPGSASPADSMAPPVGGADSGAGPGFGSGTSDSRPAATNDQSSSSTGSSSTSGAGSSSNSSGDDHGKGHKHR